MTTRSTTTIEAVELAKVYGDGTRALSGISFAAEAGEIFGLLGPNGSGKTTAVRIFVTLLQATSGAARVAGFDVGRDRGHVRQLIGYSGQYAGVDQDLTVMENLILSGRRRVARTDPAAGSGGGRRGPGATGPHHARRRLRRLHRGESPQRGRVRSPA
jgi:ABC-type multidrug transport system ATPase subunit